MYKSIRAITVFLTLAVFLGACLPAAQQTEAPQVQNTPGGIIDVQSQINTSVAQTIEAQNQIGTFVAQTVEAQASPTPLATPIPTFTPFVIGTVTNTPWAGGGSGGGGGGGSGGGSGGPVNNGAWDCAIVSQKPYDGDRIWKPGDSFDVEWTIKNNGTKELPADLSLVAIGGTDMSPTPSYMLGHVVRPGETFTFRIEVIAPRPDNLDRKQYVMQWAVVLAGTKLCRPYISIYVQRQ
jgi:hypothetical protein